MNQTLLKLLWKTLLRKQKDKLLIGRKYIPNKHTYLIKDLYQRIYNELLKLNSQKTNTHTHLCLPPPRHTRTRSWVTGRKKTERERCL